VNDPARVGVVERVADGGDRTHGLLVGEAAAVEPLADDEL